MWRHVIYCRLVLKKEDLDDAFRDKRFPESGKVEMLFEAGRETSSARGQWNHTCVNMHVYTSDIVSLVKQTKIFLDYTCACGKGKGKEEYTYGNTCQGFESSAEFWQNQEPIRLQICFFLLHVHVHNLSMKTFKQVPGWPHFERGKLHRLAKWKKPGEGVLALDRPWWLEVGTYM